MKHTSVNLTYAHIDLIKQTGKSPSVVIRDALDNYFRDEPSALELIELHKRRYHMLEIAHKKRINLEKKWKYVTSSENTPVRRLPT